MKIEKIISVIIMAAAISVFAGIVGLFFNIVNPRGIALMSKPSIIIGADVVKPEIKKPSVKVTVSEKPAVVAKKTPVAQIPIKKVVPVEVRPITSEVFADEKAELTLAQAKKCFDSKVVTFVDARAEFAYIEKHIKGAISLSASRFNFQYGEMKEKPDKEAYYMVYCSSKSCHLSDMVAGYMKENGFKNVKVFGGGWDEWEEAGYPIEGIKIKNN